jgi:hypothetical protein
MAEKHIEGHFTMSRGVRAASSVGSGLVELYKKRRW